jgi:hypothetical protein
MYGALLIFGGDRLEEKLLSQIVKLLFKIVLFLILKVMLAYCEKFRKY